MKRNTNRAARRAYIEELAVARVAMKLAAALDQSDKNQKDIADALGVTEARVSQIMNGEANLTIKTLARIADAIGQEFEPHFGPAQREVPRLVESAQEPLICITNSKTIELGKWHVRDFMEASVDEGASTDLWLGCHAVA
jgi:transcriptional regulator with XRE-family HTH domain